MVCCTQLLKNTRNPLYKALYAILFAQLRTTTTKLKTEDSDHCDNHGPPRKRPRSGTEETSVSSVPNYRTITNTKVETPILFAMELCVIPDFTLIVGESLGPARIFKVSRLALCCASPVFSAMLASPFKESTQDELVLEDDNPEALLVFLRTAHLRFHEVHREFATMEELLYVTTICDKYDIVAICRTFIPGWVEQYLGRKFDEFDRWPEQLPELCKWLWPTFVFGYEEEYVAAANSIVRHLSTRSDGRSEFEDEILKYNIHPQIFG